ncbi:MAG TPA: WVD2 family protein [Gallionellaceae bacterium]|nr:WVD2 family protein [Gallionellaceae bacterium]
MNTGSSRADNAIRSFFRQLRGLNERRRENTPPDEGAPYNDLAPVDNADEDNKYCEALKWALGNEKIKNIAITGPFGSGKSSVLRTFEGKHKKYKYLNISLGTFKDDLERDNSDEDRNSLIEKSILQQIFYRVQGDAIPYSRLARISNDNFFSYLPSSVAIVVWIGACLFLYLHRTELDLSLARSITAKTIPTQVLGLTFAIGLVAFVNKTLRILKHSRLNEISISTGKLKFDDTSGTSILNRHLDEILYFFEKTKFDVVTIEDLDRFDEVDIFIKLRELNTLINNSDQVRRKIVFIYAIRDEVFTDSTRTKFFDFILPIIPVINASNSGEILFRKLSSLTNSIDRQFISDITLYIDDMRMLKNIYNEFKIYRAKLGKIGDIDLPLDKLLGFIVYKNKYPDDFAILNVDKGMVADTFNNKRKIIEEIVLEKEAEKQKLRVDLEAAENEIAQSIKELRLCYIGELTALRPGVASLRLGHQQVAITGLLQDSAFNEFKSSAGSFSLLNSQGLQISPPISFAEVEKALDSRLTYDQREHLINSRMSAVEGVKNKIQRLTQELQDMHSWSVKELLEQSTSGAESVFSDKRYADKKLLQYLIRYGYIDEMYHSFISYFYEGNLTKQDMAFILSVKNQEPLDFSYPLFNREEVIGRLGGADFSKRASLNFDLLETLLANRIHAVDLKSLLNQVSTAADALEFIDGFLARKRASGQRLIQELCASWPKFWQSISQDSGYPKGKLDEYMKMIITYAEIEDISRMNVDSSLTLSISECDDFLALMSDAEDADKIKDALSALEIRLNRINSPDTNPDLFAFVLQMSMYQINAQTIEAIIRYTNPDGYDANALNNSNYSAIIQSNCTPLISHIDEAVDNYVRDVFLTIETNTHESEGAIVRLLNNKRLDDNLKQSILEKEVTQLRDLSNVEDSDLWHHIFFLSRVQPTWENVLIYFGEGPTLDDYAISYLNRKDNYAVLSAIPLKDEQNDEAVDMLSRSIIECAQLTDDAYGCLVKAIQFNYGDINFHDLRGTQVTQLINNQLIALTRDNFQSLKSGFNDEYPRWLELNIGDLIGDLSSYELDAPALTYLLESHSISNVDKATIAAANAAVFENNDEITKIAYQVFSEESDRVQLHPELLRTLLKQDVKLTKKIKLLTTQLDHLEHEAAISILTLLGDYATPLLSSQQVVWADSASNRAFAEKLVAKSIVSSYKAEMDKLRLYPKRS